MFKFGYVTVVGKPNAGKSTLLNKLVGFKVAITTPKPQTTRFNIKGIVTKDTCQFVIIDTPGIHLPKQKLGEYMMEGVENAISSVDVIIYLVDATKSKIDSVNEDIMKKIVTLNKKVILAINKIDKIDKTKIFSIIENYNNYFKSLGGNFCDIIPVSVYKNDGIDILVNCIENNLPEGQMEFAEDEITNITEREIVEEIIREKALNNLDKEVPHGIKVDVEKFKESTNKEGLLQYNIDVNIICSKNSHKGIIIGHEGRMLKKITREARIDIENTLETKVNLKIWVKVRENWQKNELYLKNIKFRSSN